MNIPQSPNPIRICVCFVLLIETLALLGIVPFAKAPEGVALSWYWVVYQAIAYFLLYELPLLFLWNSPYRKNYIFVGWLWFLNLFFDTIGTLGNLYITTDHYDDFMHMTFFPWGITGSCMGFSAIYCLKNKLHQVPKLLLILSFTGAATLLAFHEVVELSMDWLSNSNLGTSAFDIDDTGRDLLCDFIGISSFCALAWAFFRKKWLAALAKS